MAYRPSLAGFELNTGSALAGLFPASFKAAAIGSAFTLLAIFADALTDEHFSLGGLSIWIIPGLIFFMLVAISIATAFCAFYVGLVGVSLAALLGHRLGTRLGLAVSVGAALLAGLVAVAVFGFRTPPGELDWPLALIVLPYALPAGLLYRRAVIDARCISPFAEIPA